MTFASSFGLNVMSDFTAKKHSQDTSKKNQSFWLTPLCEWSKFRPQMARQIATRRQYLHRPGVNAAAEMLGCTYSHLRRVLAGERQSKSLLNRYNSLDPQSGDRTDENVESPVKHEPKQKRTPPHINFAAAQNFDPKFSEYLSRLKFDTVILRLEFRQDSPALAFPTLTDELDAALHAARAGQYDSSAWFQGSVQHYFYSQALGRAAQIIKDGIASRGLLDTAQIFVKEVNGTLTEWFPGTGKEIPT